MSQFCVHRNPNPNSNATIPFLLDVQSEPIADLDTRVVAPICHV